MTSSNCPKMVSLISRPDIASGRTRVTLQRDLSRPVISRKLGSTTPRLSALWQSVYGRSTWLKRPGPERRDPQNSDREVRLPAGAAASHLRYCPEGFGGRTRIRTLDPLIKSQLSLLEFQGLRRKPF